MPKEPIYVDWTIASAANSSGRVALSGHSLYGIKVPAGWDTNQDIGIQGATEDPFSDHLTASWQTLTDQQGNAVRLTGVAAGKMLSIDPRLTTGPRQIRFVSLNAVGALEVVAADRSGQAMLRRDF